MANPYSSPIQPDPSKYNPYGPPGGGQYPPGAGQDSYVKQVPIIGILMMVQAGLELIASLGLIALGFGMPTFIRMMEAQEGRPGAAGMPPGAEVMMMVMYGGLGIALLGVAALRFFAGFRVMNYRNRILAIVANSIGFGSALTCYCGLTSLALGIYALIVLLQPVVVYEFNRRAGQS